LRSVAALGVTTYRTVNCPAVERTSLGIEAAATPDTAAGPASTATFDGLILLAELIGNPEQLPNSKARWSPITRIWSIRGQSAAERVADIEAIDGNLQFVLSHDKTRLLLFVEGEVRILDLRTGQVRSVFKPTRQFQRMAFSPDDSQILINDQSLPESGGAYSVYRINLSDLSATLFASGSIDGFLNVVMWRRDGKVLIRLSGYGGEGYPGYFDLSGGRELHEPPVRGLVDLTSTSGAVMAVVTRAVPYKCLEEERRPSDAYDIVDPVSGAVLDSISSKGNKVEVHAFSDNDAEYIYSVTRRVKANADECLPAAVPKYYVRSIASHRSTLVGPERKFPLWAREIDFKRAKGLKFGGNVIKNGWVLFNGDMAVFKSRNQLHLIEPPGF